MLLPPPYSATKQSSPARLLQLRRCRRRNVLVQAAVAAFSLGTPEGVLQSSRVNPLLHWGSVASPDPIQSSRWLKPSLLHCLFSRA